MLPRKIISASISGSIFAILLAVIVPNPFGSDIPSLQKYLSLVVLTTPIYMMYSFPAILIYGVLTSIISDKISGFLSTKVKDRTYEIIFSGIFHAAFGLVLLWYSLGAATLFFITDRFLKQKHESYTASHAIKSLGIPFAVWLFFMAIVYAEHFINMIYTIFSAAGLVP